MTLPIDNSGGNQRTSSDVNRRKSPITPIATDQEKSEIRVLLDVKNGLIETLRRHNLLLVGKSLSAASKNERDRREQRADRKTERGRQAGASERKRDDRLFEIVRENDEEHAGRSEDD